MKDIPRCSSKYLTHEWDHIIKSHKPLNKPSHTGWLGILWDDLSILRQNTNSAWLNQWKPVCIIAVTQFIDFEHDIDAKGYSDVFVKPQDINLSWTHLGYDVADGGMTGFITNAGYRDNEVESLKQQWSEHFNQYHLFDDLTLAAQYVDVAYQRDANHGPFSVYGVYGIERIELGKNPIDLR